MARALLKFSWLKIIAGFEIDFENSLARQLNVLGRTVVSS